MALNGGGSGDMLFVALAIHKPYFYHDSDE